MAVFSLGCQSQEMRNGGSVSRGATTEGCTRLNHRCNFTQSTLNCINHKNAVASRLIIVRLTIPGTRVPGFKLPSRSRLKPTNFRIVFVIHSPIHEQLACCLMLGIGEKVVWLSGFDNCAAVEHKKLACYGSRKAHIVCYDDHRLT